METSQMDVAPVIVARERIMLATGASLLIAGLILVVAVLPAEYGVDALGRREDGKRAKVRQNIGGVVPRVTIRADGRVFRCETHAGRNPDRTRSG